MQVGGLHQAAEQAQSGKISKGRNAEIMRFFRIHAEEHGSNGLVVVKAHLMAGYGLFFPFQSPTANLVEEASHKEEEKKEYRCQNG